MEAILFFGRGCTPPQDAAQPQDGVLYLSLLDRADL